MRTGTEKKIRAVGMVLFCLYIVLLVYFLFFAEGYGRVPLQEREYRYNLVPFVEIRRFWIYREQLGTLAVFTNIFGNVIGFVPYGFILPIISKKTENLLFVTSTGFLGSLLVETVQLITRVGSFDVYDLILNTLGAFLGCLLFMVCNKVWRWYHGEEI